MGRPPLKIDVTKKDQYELRTLMKSGVQHVRVVLRALALLQLAQEASAPQIAKVIPLTPQKSGITSPFTTRQLMEVGSIRRRLKSGRSLGNV
jgi:hypothetical protein